MTWSASRALERPVIVPTWMDDWLELLSESEKANVRYREIDGWFVAVVPFAFTAGIIVGHVRDRGCYEDRWCFETLAKAYLAFDGWDGLTGEPMGWHRHPMTGRHRVDGDPSREYINL